MVTLETLQNHKTFHENNQKTFLLQHISHRSRFNFYAKSSETKKSIELLTKR